MKGLKRREVNPCRISHGGEVELICNELSNFLNLESMIQSSGVGRNVGSHIPPQG
jgi:hypothetical protein